MTAPSLRHHSQMETLDPATKIVQDGFTFDDVLLVPAYSEISPAEACTDPAHRDRPEIPLISPR